VTHEWIEHTGEVELTIEASSRAGVLEEAMAALAELLVEDAAGAWLAHKISVAASDRPALLVAWLDELVYLAETTGFRPERIAQMDCSELAVEATIEGRVGRPSHLVKAVTYHDLAFEGRGDRWEAQVVLDV
jgi:SHS2 domain-containing protein